jgi:hypothetical protein
MINHFLPRFASLLFELFASIRRAPDEKDSPIALLRQQRRVLERKAKTKPRLLRPEKLMLVALMTRLQMQTGQWQQCAREAVLLIQPETILKWHWELVGRKWTFRQPDRGGRPRSKLVLKHGLFASPGRTHGWGTIRSRGITETRSRR